jgi:hypothetical protein
MTVTGMKKADSYKGIEKLVKRFELLSARGLEEYHPSLATGSGVINDVIQV